MSDRAKIRDSYSPIAESSTRSFDPIRQRSELLQSSRGEVQSSRSSLFSDSESQAIGSQESLFLGGDHSQLTHNKDASEVNPSDLLEKIQEILNKHEKIISQQEEYKRSIYEIFFPNFRKDYNDLINTCEIEHSKFDKKATEFLKKVTENSYDEKLYRSQREANSLYEQAIAKTETFLETIEAKIESLPDNLKLYVDLHEAIEESISEINKEINATISDITNCKTSEDARKVMINFKCYTESFLEENSEKMVTIRFLEQLAESIGKIGTESLLIEKYIKDLEDRPHFIQECIDDGRVLQDKDYAVDMVSDMNYNYNILMTTMRDIDIFIHSQLQK